MTRHSTTAALLGVATCLELLATTAPADDTPAGGTDDIRAAAARHGAGTSDPDRAGIWKAITPLPGSTQGEFDSEDPIGLTAGKRLKADCSINWVDPDTGKRYCFLSGTSLVSFMAAPHAYEADASAAWARLNAAGGH